MRRYTHLKIEMADVDTADIGPHLAPAYEFIETALAGKKGARQSRAADCPALGCVGWSACGVCCMSPGVRCKLMPF